MLNFPLLGGHPRQLGPSQPVIPRSQCNIKELDIDYFDLYFGEALLIILNLKVLKYFNSKEGSAFCLTDLFFSNICKYQKLHCPFGLLSMTFKCPITLTVT